MSERKAASPDLLAKATEFADSVTARLQRIINTRQRLSAVLSNDDSKVSVYSLENGKFAKIPLTISNKHRLDLSLKFNCCWDSHKRFLAVEASWMHVFPKGETAQLFRYEYVRNASRGAPCAHLHVHAHRDEFTYLLTAADRGRPGRRQAKDALPRLSEFHFPLGGHRFRPCIEDLLQALVEEFHVDAVDGWRTAVTEGREQWRRLQLRAAVRDAPDEAAEALKDLDYNVKPPDVTPAHNLDRLRAY